MNNSLNKRLYYLIPPIFTEGVIYWFSDQDGDESGAFSGGLAEKAARFLFRFIGKGMSEAESTEFLKNLESAIREAGHAGEHALLMLSFFIMMCMMRSKDGGRGSFLKKLVPAFILTVIFAILDEIHQSFVPGRACEAGDVLVDSIGALCMCLVLTLIHIIGRKHKKRDIG